VIFSLPPDSIKHLFPANSNKPIPQHLAYVEWFSTFSAAPQNIHQLYKIQQSYSIYRDEEGNRKWLASIIDVNSIHHSIHLIPQFGPYAPREWTSFNVLDECRFFYVNCFTDRHTYITLCYAISSIAFLFTTSLVII
jgi:hypothetical protein